MDYESEQAMELEALEAIFADQLEEFEGNRPEGWSNHGKTWAITIHPSAGAGASGREGPGVLRDGRDKETQRELWDQKTRVVCRDGLTNQHVVTR